MQRKDKRCSFMVECRVIVSTTACHNSHWLMSAFPFALQQWLWGGKKSRSKAGVYPDVSRSSEVLWIRFAHCQPLATWVWFMLWWFAFMHTLCRGKACLSSYGLLLLSRSYTHP